MTTMPIRLNLLVVALLAMTHLVMGAEYRADKSVKVGAEETIKDDLYAFGETITIDGIIEGDLIVFAKDIIINGEVRGDVIGAGQTIETAGTLGDDVRMAGMVLKVGPKSKIGGDVIAAGMSLEAEKDSTIAGDFIFAGYQALLAGQIDKDVLAGIANMQVAGKIRGDMEIYSDGDKDAPSADAFTQGQQIRISMPQVPGGLTFDSTSEVGGKLKYTSAHEAKIDEAAKMLGGVSHEIPKADPAQPNAPPPEPDKLQPVYDGLRHFICAALVGLVVFLVLPKSSLAWADNIRTRPLASFGGGILGFFGFGIVAIGLILATVIIAIGAGMSTLNELIPTVVVGGILGFGILVFVFVLFLVFLAQAVVGMALGRMFLKQDSLGTRLGAFLIGLVVVAIAVSIPYAGGMLALVVFLFGLGGYTLWLAGYEPVVETDPPSTPPPRPTTVRAPMKG